MIHLLSLFTAAIQAPGSLPVTDPTTGTTVKTVFSFIFGLAGAIALLVISVAGLRYTISRGNPESVKNAKSTIIYAIVGLVIAMSGYTLVNYVFTRVR